MFGPQGRVLHGNGSREEIKASLHPPRHRNNGLNSGLPSIPRFCTAAVALCFHDDRGRRRWRWELTTTPNYTVVSSPLADNWTCNHNRRLFSPPRSRAAGRRGADLNDPLTPAVHRSPRPHHATPALPLGERDSLRENEFLHPLTGTANGFS